MIKRNELTYYIAVFESKNHAIYLYQHLRRKGIKEYELVSTPCQIRSGCSYALKFKVLESYDLLQKESVYIKCKILSVYSIERINGKRIFKQIVVPT
ncbi:DUF3343 domain-containing protein [Alkaliphilus peptidifermentans]|uniref:Putative Se/S carrier protein-like domain-containing protein n=1 Tax=Alkaliphilus peptidifermentans DSM 18978 TaxID=1120976 RepID=A0A1G5H2U0_9FIRM|nr:DUF3343 domain-containing protein [Alkaliphilus peptidifermentans]SCY57991.1 Protein of unknown function [Alkaliphilus peptidifermentans DSM 18978]